MASTMPGWGKREAQRLDESFKAGAKGLKFHKTLGLGFRYKDGRLVPVDDPKLDPIWEVCAKFNRPVVIHTADPAAFFTPLDRLQRALARAERASRVAVPRQGISQARRTCTPSWIASSPGTRTPRSSAPTWATTREDLAAVGRRSSTRYPNMYVDIDARISELGRQPYTARRFFLKYQDRIMFGTDTTPGREAYRIYYRFLETDDEYFDPAAGHHRTGVLEHLRHLPAAARCWRRSTSTTPSGCWAWTRGPVPRLPRSSTFAARRTSS